jgi:hypothetical protein
MYREAWMKHFCPLHLTVVQGISAIHKLQLISASSCTQFPSIPHNLTNPLQKGDISDDRSLLQLWHKGRNSRPFIKEHLLSKISVLGCKITMNSTDAAVKEQGRISSCRRAYKARIYMDCIWRVNQKHENQHS